MKCIGALLVLGCLGLAVVATCAPASTPPEKNTLVVGLGAEPRSLDPHTTTASSDFRVLVNVFEGLTRFAPGSLTVEPWLCERWEITEQGKAYTFHLKAGVTFHDGTRFDAEAVKFNFDRMLDKQHPFHHTGPFPLAFFFERVRRVKVVDAFTVRFELDQAFAPLLSNLAYPTGLLVSPASVERYGKAVNQHPVGTGPFRFAGWEPGQRLVLERHPDYHGQTASLERVIYRSIADPMTRVAELRAKHLDLAVELSPDNVTWFRRAPGFRVAEAAGPHLWFLILNTKQPPFSDARVRQAVNYAVDKRALVEQVLQGTASIAKGPIAEAFGAAAGNVEAYPYDPTRAKRLLREAGVPAGQRLLLAAPQSGSGMLAPIPMATAIQADLKAIGLEVDIETYEWNSYLGTINKGLGRAHMAEMAWMTNDPDTLPFLTLRSEAKPPHGFNSGWYENAELDALLTKARAQTDPALRARTYAKIQRLVHDDAPWLFVASWKQNVVVRREVRQLRLEPSFLLHLGEVSK